MSAVKFIFNMNKLKNLSSLNPRGRRFIHRSSATCTSTDSNNDKSPLAGIRVLDLTRIIAGPYCTMILGDLGAEILKIEKPGTGDECRNWGPPFLSGTKHATYFLSVNRNKKSVCIDFKKGRDIIYELAKKSDVLIENFVPGKLSKMGLGYEDLKKAAPQLIYCSLTGYGYEGPYAQRPGYDVIAASVGGLMHITGPKDGDPCKVGIAITDVATGLYAHGAIMAALYQRTRNNQGQWIQCNLLSTQVACLINVASNYLNAGKEATRWGSEHESLVPYEAFPTSDGFMTVCTGSDAQFKALVDILELPELANDERFINNTARVINRVELLKILRNKFKIKSNKEWAEILEGAPFPYGPINSIQEVFDDPHIKAIKMVKELEHDQMGKVKVVGPAVKFSYGENQVRSPPPTLGQHTRQVLKQLLNYSDQTIDSLIKNKIDVPTISLCLRKPRSNKKVQWTSSTVDNENMNKKKSKCCCIYEKPKQFGESSSDESDDECEHCHGRKEVHKKGLPGTAASPHDNLPQPESIVGST
ncbi:Similar to SUGCT: Succinate--hydroxymethylglutarate CoA-transferase (Homo sapiens) [Cotesia congregata]|uniref:Similar to SUGCT: Succinate--hydroxymethylglutarate CoA-transferase (Homo sapiens) n=1 Tax=Cotesia congregata TaxID=51543 RepID=A0A8J2MTH3_COTCN|nr:Similar to SUGCT: Succinate--hydroxymethylglutarate CoA-transferase (Homo sapiens) [Cotesia congregata]